MDAFAERRKGIILFLLAAQYAFVNLSFYIGTQNIVLIKDVSAPFFSMLILVVWTAAEVHATGGWRLRPSPINAPLVAYLFWMALSCFWSVHLNASVWESGRFAVYFVALLAAVRFIETWRDFRFLYLAHLWTGAAVSLYALTQVLGADALEILGWIPSWGTTDIISTHGNKNFTAAHIIITGSMALGYAAFSRSVVAALASLSLWLLDVFLVVESTARGAYVGFFLSASIIAATCFWNRRRLPVLVSETHRTAARRLLGSLATAAVLVLVAKPQVLTGPVNTVFTEYTETMRYGVTGGYNYVRLIFWQMAMGVAADHPIAGTGVGTFQVTLPTYRFPWYHRFNVSHNTMITHNEWLNNYPEVGIVGVGLLFWVVATIGWTFLRHARARREGSEFPLLPGLVGGIVAFLVQTTFDVESRWTGNAVTYWQTVGLLFAAAALPSWRGAALPERRPTRAPTPVRRPLGAVLAAVGLAGVAYYGSYAAKAFRADSLLRENMMITEAGQPGDPLFVSEESKRLDPYSLTNYYKLAYSYLAVGRWDDALQTYRDLQFFAPNYAQIHLNIGVLFRQRGYAYDSIWELKRASTIEDNIRNLTNLADLFAQSGDYRRTVPYLRRALRIYYDDPDGGGHNFLYHREAILSGLADAYIALGRSDLAEKQVRAALSISPGHVTSLLHLARLLRASDPARASALVGEVLAANPNEPEALLFIGEAALQAGDFRAAVAHLGRLAMILPPGAPGSGANGRYAQVIFDAGAKALASGTPGIDAAGCMDMMGWAFAVVGRYDQALPRLQDAYQRTQDPRVAAHLARIRAVASM